MKQLLILLFFILTGFNSFSQNDNFKGKFIVKGNFPLTSSKGGVQLRVCIPIRKIETSFGIVYDDKQFSISEKSKPNFKFEGRLYKNDSVPVNVEWYDISENQIYFSNVMWLKAGVNNVNLEIDTINKRTIISGDKIILFDEYNQMEKKYNLSNNDSNALTKAVSFNNENQLASALFIINVFLAEKYRQEMTPLISKFDKKVIDTSIINYMIQNIIEKGEELFINDEFPYEKLSYGNLIKNKVGKSKYFLIEFWATWCNPCIKNIPNWKKLYNNTNRKTFDILGITLETSRDKNSLKNYLLKSPNPWKDIIDYEGKESEKIKVTAIPFNFLLNNKGMIIGKDVNAEDVMKIIKGQ